MERDTAINWGLLVGLSIIWGSSFILIKNGLIAFSPLQMGAMRIAIATLTLLPFFYKKLSVIKTNDLAYVAVVGILGGGIPAILFAVAQTEISSSTTGTLNSLTPLFTFIIGITFFKTHTKWVKLLGVLMGMLGAILLIINSTSDVGTGNNWYTLFIVGATICYATSINTVKRYCQHIPSPALTLGSFLFFFPIAASILVATDVFQVFQVHPQVWFSFGSVALLAIVGTALANIFFFKMAQRTNALFASTVTYLIPVVAILIGWMVGEPIDIWHFLGLFMIVGGVYWVGKS